MRRRRLRPTVECVNQPLERSPAMKQNPFVISAAIAVVILVAAFATLGVLAAFAGQQSGLEKSGCKIHCSR
jgi:hypothetical protein